MDRSLLDMYILLFEYQEHAVRTPTQNMFFEHTEHVVRTPGTGSACTLRIQCLCSNNMVCVFEQHVLGVIHFV